MDSLLREYERLAKNGDGNAERRLIELKKRAGCLDIYVVEEHLFLGDNSVLDVCLSLDDATTLVNEKILSIPSNPADWKRKQAKHLAKGVELAFIWDNGKIRDPGFIVSCFIK